MRTTTTTPPTTATPKPMTLAFPYPSRLNRLSAARVTRALHHAIGLHLTARAEHGRRVVVRRDPRTGQEVRLWGHTWAGVLTQAGARFGWGRGEDRA